MRECVRAIIVRDSKLLLMKRNKFGDKFYALIGGGVDDGETTEQALKREVLEETGYTVMSSRWLYVEPSNTQFGPQHIALCEVSGDVAPSLQKDSVEEQEFAEGNEHTPVWVATSELPQLVIRPDIIKRALVLGLRQGFPENTTEPELTGEYLDSYYTNVKKEG